MSSGGVPIDVVCRLRPLAAGAQGAGDSRIIDGATIQLLPESGLAGAQEDVYQLQYIYGQETRQQDLFERSVERYVHALVDGVNVSVLALGESGAGKTHTLVGVDGMLQQAVATAFGLLTAKAQAAQRDGRSMGPPELRMSVFEIFEEEIRDLLVPQSKVLELESTPGGGTWVSGLSNKRIDEVAQVQQSLDKARSCAKTHVTDFGPGANFTSTFYVVELRQKQQQQELVSRMVLLDLAGSEKLGEDLESLQIHQGMSINKSIISFGAVVNALAAPSEKPFVSWQESQLTALLRDILSANCFTLVIAVLSAWHFKESSVTLRYATQLQKLSTFPVPNEQKVRGLIATYRSEVLQLLEDLRAAQSASERHETGTLLLKIKELEAKAINENLTLIKLTGEKEQLFDRLVRFREHYNQVVEGKAELQQKLIDKEEDYLTVSKALLDLEVEKAQLQETAETSKYEVMNKLLNAENELVKYEMRDEEMSQRVSKMKAEMESMVKENEQLTLEFVAMKENCVNSQADLKRMTEEKDNLSLEMFNLINAKKELTRIKEDLTRQTNEKTATVGQLREQIGKAQDEGLGRNAQVDELKQEVEELKAALHRAEYELETRGVEFESGKVQVEKQFLHDTREKDMEIMLLKERFDDERKQSELTRKELNTQIAELQRTVRNEGHRADDIQAALTEAQHAEAAAHEEANELQRRILESGDEYRGKLRRCMEDLAEMHSLATGPDPGAAQSQLQTGMDAMLQDMVHSHQSKESELSGINNKYKKRIQELIQKNHKLHAAHRKCREQVFALAPAGVVPEVDEGLELKAELHGEIETDLISENRSLRDRLQQVEGELMHSQQEALKLGRSYQSTIQTLTDKTQATSKSLEQLTHQNQALIHEKEALQKGLDTAGANSDQILALERQSLESINKIREGGIQVKRDDGDVTVEDMRLESQLHQLQDEKAQLLEMIEHKNQEMSRAIQDQDELRRVRLERDHMSKQIEVITAGDNTRQRLSDMVVQLQTKLKERGPEGGGTNELRKEMREFTLTKQKELEKERAELKMKLTMAQSKLSSMESYMEATIQEYQIQIMQLRNQLGQRQ